VNSVQPFNALALQINTRGINKCSDRSSAQQLIDANLSHVEKLLTGSNRFIQVFAGDAVKLVVLPEYFLTSFPFGESIDAWKEKGCLAPVGAEYDRLGALAQTLGIYLSGNVYELDNHFPNLYFQTSFIISPSGDVICRYRRLISMFAPTPHDVLDEYLDHYGSDSLFPVAKTELGNMACVASEEILYPELSRALMLNGAEIICHSSSEVASNLMTPKNIAKRARASENMAYVVSANSAAITDIDFPAESTTGSSQIVDFKGTVMAETIAGESSNANALIDIERLRQARRKPAMTNLIARQRYEVVKDSYSNIIYPANNLADKVPDRQHFLDTQKEVIQNLIDKGVIE